MNNLACRPSAVSRRILRYKHQDITQEVLTSNNASTSSRCSGRSFFLDAYCRAAAVTLPKEDVVDEGCTGEERSSSCSVSLPSSGSPAGRVRFPSDNSGIGLEDLFIASSTACSAAERKNRAPSL